MSASTNANDASTTGASTGASEELTYASSGVDIDSEAASVAALLRSVRTVGKSDSNERAPGTVGAPVAHPGGFSGLIEFGDNALLAMCTDGVGSKMQLAAELGRYDTVGIDVVAMNVNDLLCVGAEPLAFVDYIAAPKPDPETWSQLGVGLARGCTQARVTLSGGESASLPGMVTHVDMSGTALGHVQRGMQIDGNRVKPGDVIIALPASGIHSNGLSLVRRVLQSIGANLEDRPPFPTATVESKREGQSTQMEGVNYNNTNTLCLGDVFLTPTRIYVDPIVPLLKAAKVDYQQHDSKNDSDNSSTSSTSTAADKPCDYVDIHGMVHVTGGGLSNFLRLNKTVGFRIDQPLPVPSELQWLQTAGSVSNFEMWRTFNMGMGFAIVVDVSVAAAVTQFLNKRLPGCAPVGVVTADAGRITHDGAGVTYDRY